MDLEIADAIDHTHQHFGQIFIGGVPALLNADGAYLSFICVFAGVEALAGFRWPAKQNGERFRDFISEYFEPPYQPMVSQLWDLRNSMVHSFSFWHFALAHHASAYHFKPDPQGQVILNAEDVYTAFVAAAQKYFAALRTSSDLQNRFAQRLADPNGGGLAVRPY